MVFKRFYVLISIVSLMASPVMTDERLSFRLGIRYGTWSKSVIPQIDFSSGRWFSRAYLNQGEQSQYSIGTQIGIGKALSLSGFAYYREKGALQLNVSGNLHLRNTDLAVYYRANEGYGNVQFTQRIGKIRVSAMGGVQKKRFDMEGDRFTGSIEITIPLDIVLNRSRYPSDSSPVKPSSTSIL